MTSASTRVYVGLGSNLDNPLEQLRQALRELNGLMSASVVQVSSLYRSTPMGPAEQPDYLNAVAAMDTSLSAEQFLELLQGIEEYHRRVRTGQRWGPRTLDLDIILFGDQRIQSEYLQVPHSGMHERNFVLYPLAEIVDDLEVPGHGTLQALLQNCSREGLQRLDDPLL